MTDTPQRSLADLLATVERIEVAWDDREELVATAHPAGSIHNHAKWLAEQVKQLVAQVEAHAPPPQEPRAGPRVYVASRTRHAIRWRALRDHGYPFTASWIDEAGAGETEDYGELMARCITEARNATAIVLYAEGDDCLGWKGAWFELGAALGAGVPAFFAGVHNFSSPLRHPGVKIFASLDAALVAARDVPLAVPSLPAPGARLTSRAVDMLTDFEVSRIAAEVVGTIDVPLILTRTRAALRLFVELSGTASAEGE